MVELVNSLVEERKMKTREERVIIANEIINRMDTVTLCTLKEVMEIRDRAQTGEFDSIFDNEEINNGLLSKQIRKGEGKMEDSKQPETAKTIPIEEEEEGDLDVDLDEQDSESDEPETEESETETKT